MKGSATYFAAKDPNYLQEIGDRDMSQQVIFMIGMNTLALVLGAFAFTVYEFRRHVIEDPAQKDQVFHGEKVNHHLPKV